MIVRMEMIDRTVDQAAVDRFGDRLVAMLNESARARCSASATARAVRSAGRPTPLTSTAIAEPAGCRSATCGSD